MSFPASRPHEEAVIEELREDPAYAAEYLNVVLQEGDEQEMAHLLRRLAQALGDDPQQLVRQADQNASVLFKALSPQANPGLKPVLELLAAMKMRLAIVPAVTEPAESVQAQAEAAVA